jgi:two-component system, cell cycle sensor histidine kinase and response regulator CckA
MSGPRNLQDSERDALRDRNRELATLLDVSKRLASTLHLEEILQAATDGVTRLHALKTAAVYLGEGDVLRLSATTPPLPPGFPDHLRHIALADHPYLREAIESGAPAFLKDAASAPLTEAEAAVTHLRGLRSVLFLPLTAGVRCVGALIVGSVDEPVTLSPAEVDSCRTLANLAALAVQNAQLYEIGRRNAADLERRIAERERTDRALRESEERLRLALMAAEQGLYDLDVQTGETVVTPEYARMLGYEPDEFTETNARWIERLHPDDREAVAGAYRAYVAGEAPEYRVEFRQRTKAGDWKWILSIGKIVRYDEAGRPLRMLGTHTDITKRKEAEEERARLTAQLLHAQKMESVGRLAGGVAHDFNNMLLVILACTELIRMRHREDAKLLASLQEIERAALRARDVTRQLLAVSRKQTAAPRTLDLSGLLAETRTTLGRLIGEDVDLAVHLATDLWPVRIDPSQVDQVLMNLVVNARDAMPTGGKLTIETTNVRIDESYCRRHAGFREGDYVLLAVSDTGVGMERETLAHVFEPFFTTKDVGKGTGLGLATVHGIVAQNGGVVTVHSEPGRGATFRVYLPRMREASAAAEGAAEATPARTSGTVLLVEDDDAVRGTLAAMLEALGFGVLVAPGWREALRQAGRADVGIDILLTDVVMPELSGKELCDRVRAVHPGLPVLYMSGYTADVIGPHGILDDGVHFIQKPFAMDDLARALRTARRIEPQPPADV